MKLVIKGGTGSGKTYKAFEIAKELGTYMYLAPTKMLAYESFIAYGGYNSRINTSSVKVGDKNSPNYFGCYAAVGRWYKVPKKKKARPELSEEYQKMKKEVLEDLYILRVAETIETIIVDHFYSIKTYKSYSWEKAQELTKILNSSLTKQPRLAEVYESELHEKFAVAEIKRLEEENYKQLYEAVCNRIPNFFAYSSDKSTYKSALKSALKFFRGPKPLAYELKNAIDHGIYDYDMNYITALRAAIDGPPKEEKMHQTPPPFDTIIIDEAHWASQNDNHSFWIKKVVNEFKGNIILVTAEDINPPERFEVLELEGFHVDGTVEYSYKGWVENIENSRASLAICSSLKDAEYLSEVLDEEKIKHYLVYRGIGEDELIKAFFDFKEKGGILVSTNMAQQGINLPCDNLLLELNDYDTTVSISQKIGRIGRRGYTKSGDKNKIFVYDGSGDRSVPKDSTIESYKQFYKCSIKIDWNQHDYNHDDVPPMEYRDHEAEMLLQLFVENNRISNSKKCA